MDTIKRYLQAYVKGAVQIKKIRGEASNRAFYRVFFKKNSLVAMVYPEQNRDEIEKIVRLTSLYRQYQIRVPEVKEVIDNRVILQEDLGDLLVQKAFLRAGPDQRHKFLEMVTDILMCLQEIPVANTGAVLDTHRMKWEMDFFLTHFAMNYLEVANDTGGIDEFRQRLYRLVELIRPINTFAHRDFHTRNMLVYKKGIYLVDIQDSLRASPWYDLVSFAFDCYLDLKNSRKLILELLRKKGMSIHEEQFFMAALQRNIKALGTFGYQVTVRKNLIYRKYIKRTLNHIVSNPLFDHYFHPLLFRRVNAQPV